MHVAFIGWTNGQMDIGILMDCYKILEPLRITKFDLLDLSRGRDFLKEDKKYDIVVLNYIFRDSREEMKNDPYYDPDDPFTRTSSLHNKENWRNRLLTTKAKEILLFGFYELSEITGEYIGELPEYKMNLIEHKLPNGEVYGRVWRYSR